MQKKNVVWAMILCMLLVIGWAVSHYYFQKVPPAEPQNYHPATIVPDTPKEDKNVSKPVPEVPKESPIDKEESMEKQSEPDSISVDKSAKNDEYSPDLSEQSFSIKTEKEKEYEIMQGVTVSNKAVHVQLDEDKTRTLEIEKDPSNSNNQVQIVVKKKF